VILREGTMNDAQSIRDALETELLSVQPFLNDEDAVAFKQLLAIEQRILM
jgi:hypothetical protein